MRLCCAGLVVRNETQQVVRLKRAMSTTVDFDVPVNNYWLTQLDGSWARERHVTTRKLEPGITAFGSQRGTSSHQHSPFVAVSEGYASPEEEHGAVYGFAVRHRLSPRVLARSPFPLPSAPHHQMPHRLTPIAAA